jgi:hypothetical protein
MTFAVGPADLEGGARAGTPRSASVSLEGVVELSVEELYRRAKKVAHTHNGKSYPRHAQIDAMKALQEFIAALDASSDRSSPTAAPPSVDRG